MRRSAVLAVVGLAAACVAPDEAAPVPRAIPSPTLPAVPVPSSLVAGRVVYSGELTQGGWIRGRVPSGTSSLSLGDKNLVIADDGTFFAAFDRDAGPISSLNATCPCTATSGWTGGAA